MMAKSKRHTPTSADHNGRPSTESRAHAQGARLGVEACSERRTLVVSATPEVGTQQPYRYFGEKSCCGSERLVVKCGERTKRISWEFS